MHNHYSILSMTPCCALLKNNRSAPTSQIVFYTKIDRILRRLEVIVGAENSELQVSNLVLFFVNNF